MRRLIPAICIRDERGTSLVEYCIAAMILIAVFVVGGIILKQNADSRAEKSMKVLDGATGMAPCEGGTHLTGDQCL